MDKKTAGYDDEYWENEVEKSQALLKNKFQSGYWDAIFFWGMCIIVGFSIVFGPVLLLKMGLLE